MHVIFAGHVHNYQRSHPIFDNPVDQKWVLDKGFDGASNTRPKGVIYVVSGGGGARLYNPEQHDDPASWQEFTARFVSNVNSFTQVDVAGKKLTLRQIDSSGNEVDRIALTQ